MKKKAYTGGCLCGAIRYAAEGPPWGITHCHCSICRRASGAAFVTWGSFKTTDLAYEGETPSLYASTPKAKRGFCPHCGSTLSFAFNSMPDLVDIAIATLDDPEAVKPENHIFTTTQLSWAHLDDGLPRYDGEKPKKG